MRSIYKDFIWLLQEDKHLNDADRKAGGNKESICGRLTFGKTFSRILFSNVSRGCSIRRWNLQEFIQWN